MSTTAELADQYFKVDAIRSALDRRITALPDDDIEGKETLMAEIEPVLTILSDTLRRLVTNQATDVAAVQVKAAIVRAIGDLLRPASTHQKFADQRRGLATRAVGVSAR